MSTRSSVAAHTLRPLHVAHVIHRLHTGGLENGLVNLVNRLPAGEYRHTVVSLTDATSFRTRLRDGIEVCCLHKRPGQDIGLYGRLWRLFRRLRPDIVHTRNLATLEAQVPAFLAGVPGRIHGEHGRDVHDLHNTRRRYRLLRRAIRPLVHHYVPLSRDLERYLEDDIGVPDLRMSRICNGVDTQRFAPAPDGRRVTLPGAGFGNDTVVFGTVGRMEEVKDPLNLVRACASLLQLEPRWRTTLRVVMVGDGSLLERVRAEVAAAGLDDLFWLPGARDDVPGVLRALDVFVLPSVGEGISNTILEAMASGLPVVATQVGGNAELVDEGRTGAIVPPSEPDVLAVAMQRYLGDAALRRAHGAAARRRAVEVFGIEQMIARYAAVYRAVAARKGEILRREVHV